MEQKHKVCINVTYPDGEKQNVINSTLRAIPQKLFKTLFGTGSEVLIIAPSKNVKSVEIHDIKEGVKTNE